MLTFGDEQRGKNRERFPEKCIVASRPEYRPAPAHRILEAALRMLTNGAQWRMLPQGYPKLFA